MADRKFPLVDVILGAVVSLVLVLGLYVGVGPIDTLELKLYDLRAKLRAKRQVGDEIVIVAVDDSSIAQIGRWPWPRGRRRRGPRRRQCNSLRARRIARRLRSSAICLGTVAHFKHDQR